MRPYLVAVIVAVLLASVAGPALAQQPAPRPKKVKKDIFTVQCQFGAADSSRAPIGMRYGLDVVTAAKRVREALQSNGLKIAKDGVAFWTTAPVTSWPPGPRGDPWRAYAYPGVFATLVLAQKADTIVLLGGAEALCATSPGAPDSTIAVAVKLFAEDLAAILQRYNPMPALDEEPQ